MPTATISGAADAAYCAWVDAMTAEGIELDALDHRQARQRFAERAERGLLARSGITVLAAAKTKRGDLDERREAVQRTAERYWVERAEAKRKGSGR